MRQGWGWAAAAALGLSGLLAPFGAFAAATPATFTLHATGAGQSVDMPAGVYLVTVAGTYSYDSVRPGDHRADAECSTDHERSTQPVDVVAHDGLGVGYGNLYPAPLSAWQPLRYAVVTSSQPMGVNVGDPLDVAIDSLPQTWAPAVPMTIDDAGGAGAGCSANHVYTAVFTSFGGAHTFSVLDPNTSDNTDIGGGMTVTIAALF